MTTIIVGDIHARPSLVKQAVELAKRESARLIFLGDLIDRSDATPEESAACVRLVRESGAECVMGNHEAYSVFARSASDMQAWWGVDVKKASRHFDEWLKIKEHLTLEDVEWLRSLPLYIKGSGWIAVHAKLTSDLPERFVSGSITEAQIELLDRTRSKVFWAEEYDGRFGHCFFGHTRRSKLGKHEWPNATLLDWDAKNLGTVGVAIIKEE